MTKKEVLDKIEEITKGVIERGVQKKITIFQLSLVLPQNRQTINRTLNMKESERKVYNLFCSTYKVKIIKVRSIDKKPIKTIIKQRYFWIE